MAAGFLFLSPLGGAPEAPTDLEKEDGTVLAGTVQGVVGSEVRIATAEGQSTPTPLSDLSEDSRRKVLEWALPLILSNGKAFPIQFYRKHESSDGAEATGGFEVVLENRSQMDIPGDVRLEFVVHELDFGLFWGLDGSGEYRLVGESSETTEIPFDGLSSGGRETFVKEPVVFRTADPGLSWSGLADGVAAAPEPPEKLTKLFLGVNLLLGEEVVGSFVESPAAAMALARFSGDAVPEFGVGTAAEAAAAAPLGPSSLRIPLESLVIIDADNATGSGFLARIKGRPFLVTNAHVVAGARRLSCRSAAGRTIEIPDYCFLAGDRDLALIPVADEGEFLDVAESLADAITIGDPITVYGNEAGASVATELRGRVRGLGPEQVEIDARIIEGNSGSPVIDERTEKVVGVVAYYIEYEIPEADRHSESAPPSEEDSGDEAAGAEEDDSPNLVRRRFAERLDNAASWEKVSFASLAREGDAFDEYQTLVTGVAQIAMQISRNGRIPTGGFESEELETLIKRFHRQFSTSNRAGSSANRRALDDMRYQLFALMDARQRSTNRRLSTQYFRNEFERLNAFEERVREFLEDVETY